MNAQTRSKLEMARRALTFSRAHPDPSPGYAAALAALEERLSTADKLADRQEQGILAVRGATELKRLLRKKMRRSQLLHLSRVAQIAAKELPELGPKFVLRPEKSSYQTFRTAARAILAEAMNQKDLLVKHGLSDTVLNSLVDSLTQFDEVFERGVNARLAHVSASAELGEVADESVQIVKVMDALNRFRFAEDVESLRAWESASNQSGPPRAPEVKPETPQPPFTDGDLRPAA
jgi:hypothetical protein